MNSPGLTAPSLLYAVKRLELVIRARLDEMLRDSGVTTLQYTALTVLAHRDGISTAQLARDSFVTPQSMADMLRPLEARGLITREANPQSRRELLVHLTDAGRALLQEYADAAAALEQRMTAGFSATQVTALRAALQRAWESLR
ncbi:MarR family winged helix-turn-helix transcriptional regulator [Nocardioides sp. DS6]|uniref:MarR family winged helix-turn-helix transcriptional regulator n=1 Tax=Nocardioides eburneus TaxID=3231482 RepID=A0ABV3SWG5_9ACTN